MCGYCYQQAKRTTGRCACGHDGVLPGFVDNAPACRRCTGIWLNVDCVSCGSEAELYSAGRCWHCTLTDMVDHLLTNPQTQQIQPQLIPLADALKSMTRAASGITWLKKPQVQSILLELARGDTIAHKDLDTMTSVRTREHIRALLVEHGCLDPRDDYMHAFTQWCKTALTRVTSVEHRAITQRYIRWRHIKRFNTVEVVTQGRFLTSKQRVTVAINFLNYLTENGISLSAIDQGHLDAWQSTGPSTRLLAIDFLTWAKKSRLVSPTLRIESHKRGNSSKLNAQQQHQAMKATLQPHDLSPRDQALSILVLVFGQPMNRAVALTWQQVHVTDELVQVRLGEIDITLPPPLDEPFRALHTNPSHNQTAAHPNSDWIFPSTKPGHHIGPQTMSTRLKQLYAARAARLGTLQEITKTTPIAIIAQSLGYSPSTIETHSVSAATQYGRYMNDIDVDLRKAQQNTVEMLEFPE